jgi:hypothetical protein
MSKLPVYLYPNVFNVILDLDNNRSINNIMYQRKLTLQKGFKDSVQIQFKNSDQKPIPISTTTNYIMDVIDNQGRELVLTKSLVVLDDGATLNLRGLAQITFDPIDTLNLTAASYKFIIKQDNGDGTFTPAYSNTYYGITGEIEIVEDGFPIGFPVQTANDKQLITLAQYNRDPQHMGYMFFSPWFFPFPSAMTTPTPQSAVIALNNFAGVITVEGTLDNNVSNSGNANVQASTLTTYTSTSPTIGNVQLTWTGSYTAIRFTVFPDKDGFGCNYYPTGNPIGSLTNKFPNGFVDKIQYIS